MKIGLVTCKKVASLLESEQALIPLFRKKNIHAEPMVWNDPRVDWRSYDYLIIRSIWDYHLYPEEFSNWLTRIEDLGIKMLNNSKIIKLNQHKFYLKKLEEKGVDIVPTLFLEKSETLDLSPLIALNWEQAVIKPAISASAFLTEKFETPQAAEIEKKYKKWSAEREFLVQKFMPEVRTFGELSIIFFNRKYSHTVLKTASKSEFRVQSEYGGTTRLYEPEPKILAEAAGILSHFQGDMLYARVDGLIRNGRFVLMEIELVEPHLFFECYPGAIERFVDATLELIEIKQ